MASKLQAYGWFRVILGLCWGGLGFRGLGFWGFGV